MLFHHFPLFVRECRSKMDSRNNASCLQCSFFIGRHQDGFERGYRGIWNHTTRRFHTATSSDYRFHGPLFSTQSLCPFVCIEYCADCDQLKALLLSLEVFLLLLQQLSASSWRCGFLTFCVQFVFCVFTVLFVSVCLGSFKIK